MTKNSNNALSSQELYAGVERALKIQENRFGTSALFNSQIPPDKISQWCQLTEAAEQLVKQAFDRLNLSMRGYHKLLKVARTIADLQEAELIDKVHIQEAIMYRSLDQTKEKLRT